jgi:hypothetical protein
MKNGIQGRWRKAISHSTAPEGLTPRTDSIYSGGKGREIPSSRENKFIAKRLDRQPQTRKILDFKADLLFFESDVSCLTQAIAQLAIGL